MGTAKNRQVEFDVVVGAKWTEGKLGPALIAHIGVVEMRSVGATSDEFLKVMDSKYQANLHPRSMGAATRFSAISLEGNPQLLEKGP